MGAPSRSGRKSQEGWSLGQREGAGHRVGGCGQAGLFWLGFAARVHTQKAGVSPAKTNITQKAAGGNVRLEQSGESLRKKEEPEWESGKCSQG